MGIRFFCECGYRLNVKSFLAGKKGICPECGAKFVIPEKSDPRATRAPEEATKASQVKGPEEGPPHSCEPTQQAVSSEISHRPSWSGAELAIQSAAAPAPTPPVPAPPSVAEHDPIEMAGSAVWYVRHGDGGQYGPADATIMRRWLQEGRVASDSMVWHQGWTDWKQAGDVFTELAKPSDTDISLGGTQADATPPSLAVAESSSLDGDSQDSTSGDVMSFETADPTIALARQRDLRRRRSMMMLGGLVFVALTLAVVAGLILMR